MFENPFKTQQPLSDHRPTLPELHGYNRRTSLNVRRLLCPEPNLQIKLILVLLPARVVSLVDQKEMTAQNGLNVAIALLGGSILSRPRGVLTRTFLPIATGLGAAAYFMPNSVYNIDQAWYRFVYVLLRSV